MVNLGLSAGGLRGYSPKSAAEEEIAKALHSILSDLDSLSTEFPGQLKGVGDSFFTVRTTADGSAQGHFVFVKGLLARSPSFGSIFSGSGAVVHVTVSYPPREIRPDDDPWRVLSTHRKLANGQMVEIDLDIDADRTILGAKCFEVVEWAVNLRLNELCAVLEKLGSGERRACKTADCSAKN